ncbi:MAG: 16S rRNA (cytosine(1402)-N(4))-methyltransferase RsmH [Flavobacteriales bacterium]|nr:16S rRNA (cytosine(1402)-N(4))-methyltransferase RsmH [Flavobacteriales bacterium]MCB9449361.1 16S rRNA (cytosine(1402)-N(4))-methyltransferase RsmH [Flavobacteriales bacterium]
MYHEPVLLEACIRGLNIEQPGVYVDATFGGGGHSKSILERITRDSRLLAFDQDPDAAANTTDDERFTLVNQNFRYLKRYLKLHKAIPAIGILADLGVSSHQFDTPGRGFSLRFDGPLDMRMDPMLPRSAGDIIREYSSEALANMLRLYGELPQANALARTISIVRQNTTINTTFQLRDAISKHLPRGKENSMLARVFQAIRIEVNDELSALREFLEQCTEVIAEGGRLVVISYHSLEDRLVKNFMRSGNWEGEIKTDLKGNVLAPFKPVIRKAIQPDEQEILTNPRARSAKLRIAERTSWA